VDEFMRVGLKRAGKVTVGS